jgi:hypothetical protein
MASPEFERGPILVGKGGDVPLETFRRMLKYKSPLSVYKDLLNFSGRNKGRSDLFSQYMREGGDPKGVEVARASRGYEQPITALMAQPYESLKGLEQQTGLPAISWIAKAMQASPAFRDAFASVTGSVQPESFVVNEHTSPASQGNVNSTYKGAASRLLDEIVRAYPRRSTR